MSPLFQDAFVDPILASPGRGGLTVSATPAARLRLSATTDGL